MHGPAGHNALAEFRQKTSQDTSHSVTVNVLEQLHWLQACGGRGRLLSFQVD